MLVNITAMCTIMAKNSAPFLLGGDPIWNSISIRGNAPSFQWTNNKLLFINAQEALVLVKKGHYLWSKYRFKLSPNENGAEFFSILVQ